MANYYGYGIAIAKEMTPKSTKQLFELLRMAPQYEGVCVETLSEYAKDNTLEEGQNLYDLPVSECFRVLTDEDWRGFNSVAVILAEVIHEAEDIELGAVQDMYTENAFLVVEPHYPWYMGNLRDMTPETLQDIIMKYLSIITDVTPVFKEYEWQE